MRWTLADLLESTGGCYLPGKPDRSASAVAFNRVSTDSRQLGKNDLYIAVKGDRFDGHAFVSGAQAQGAVAILVSEPVETDLPCVQVADTRIALGQFAAWHRQQMPLKKLIAVTGSNGKTTCKNMMQHLLSKQAKVLATQGNLNNDFGVPRTLLQITEAHEYAVIEMGANHLNEIEYLTKLAQPDIAMITLAAGAHLEGFGSLEGVIKTKGEIFSGLKAHKGVAVLNVDSPGFEDWQADCQQRGLQILTFGQTHVSDVHYENLNQTADEMIFEVRARETKSFSAQAAKAHLPMLGEHNAQNACAALAAVMACGFSLELLTPSLADFSGVSGRLQKVPLPNGVLLDDSYNANPDSMKAAIKTLAALPGNGIACLGAMAEMGEASESGHQEVAAYARSQGIPYLLIYGEAAKPMLEAFGEGAFWFETHAALMEKAIALLSGDQIQHCLVKGSRSSEMERVSNGIVQFFNDSKSQDT